MSDLESMIRAIIRTEVAAALAERVSVTREAIDRDEQQHYSVARVAALLDVSTDYVYDRIADKSITRVVELGSGQTKQRISARELQRFINSRTHGRAP